MKRLKAERTRCLRQRQVDAVLAAGKFKSRSGEHFDSILATQC